MKTSTNRRRGKLRRLAVPAALAVGMFILPGAASNAEAHGPHAHWRAHKKVHKWVHNHARFAPVYVNYYRPRAVRPVSYYLRGPQVILHAPRVGPQVVVYPGNVPLYESGYCPAGVHYHPYPDDDNYVRVNVNGPHGSVNVRVGF